MTVRTPGIRVNDATDSEARMHDGAVPDASLPRITLVTPSFNQAQYLEDTIASVQAQEYPNLEYFVLDGGSSDGTVAIIRKHEKTIDYWRSAPDAGQAAAIAEGFARATGDLLGWLNSDDLLLPGALRAIGEASARRPDAIIAAPVLNFTPDGRVTRIEQRNLNFLSFVRLWRRGFHWHQPGVFFSRAAYERAGGLDPTLRYVMDYDLAIRLFLDGTPVVHLDRPVAKFRLHGTSKTVAENSGMAIEAYRVSSRYWELLPEPRALCTLRMLVHLAVRAGKLTLQRQLREAWKTTMGAAHLVNEIAARRPRLTPGDPAGSRRTR